MNRTFGAAAMAAGFMIFGGNIAGAVTPPAGATALCKDGTYYSGASQRGGCSHHNGVQQWLTPGAAEQSPQQAVNIPREAPILGSAAPGVPSASPAGAQSGGGNQVWVNLKSNVYHCANDRFYGKTKKGEYVPESEALAKGFHADHGKGCGQA